MSEDESRECHVTEIYGKPTTKSSWWISLRARMRVTRARGVKDFIACLLPSLSLSLCGREKRPEESYARVSPD